MWTETLSDDETVLAKKLVVSVVKKLSQSIKNKGKACLAVSGGTTPVIFFKQLSEQALDWSKVTIILVDERWLDSDHKESNEKLVRDNLLKNNAKKAYLLGLKNSAQLPSEGIMDCETQLRTQVEDLDAVILGMGQDGHTASWFAGSEQLSALLDSETSAWCLPVEDAFLAQSRMSLTWRFIKRAEKMYLHFTGVEKNQTFSNACQGISEQLPVSHILHQDGINVRVYRTQS
jgi:6-phosphogluconolactonase